MITVFFRTFNNHSVEALYKLLETPPLSTSSEWITDFLVTDQNISMDYFRKFRSVELLYDFVAEEETPEILSKAHKASCVISKGKNRAVIYGSKAACSNLERYLEKEAHIKLYAYSIELKTILNKISTRSYQIKKLEYCNVDFLNVILNTLSLEFKSNFDAQQTLRKIPTSPSKASIDIYYCEEQCTINIDLINNSMKLKYDSLKSIDLDELRELIFIFFEGE